MTHLQDFLIPLKEQSDKWDKEELEEQIRKIDEATRKEEEGKGGSEPSGIQYPAQHIVPIRPNPEDPTRDLQIDGDGNPVPDPPAPLVLRKDKPCLLYTSPSPRDRTRSRMPSSA